MFHHRQPRALRRVFIHRRHRRRAARPDASFRLGVSDCGAALTFEAAVVTAPTLLLVGRLCLGSYLFDALRGKASLPVTRCLGESSVTASSSASASRRATDASYRDHRLEVEYRFPAEGGIRCLPPRSS